MSKTTLIGLISALDYVDGWFPAYAGMTALVRDDSPGAGWQFAKLTQIYVVAYLENAALVATFARFFTI